MNVSQAMAATCWICGRQANSREHLLKASDVRAHFGTRFYLHTHARKNIQVQGSRSRALTSGAPMCADCNNSRSQPFDRAWDKVHKYLREHWHDVIRQRRFDLGRIFPGSSGRESIHLQLYFAKLMGCRAKDANVVINYDELAQSIIRRRPSSLIYLRFGETVGQTSLRTAGCSEVHATVDNATGRVVLMLWTYYVDRIEVRVGYQESAPGLRVWSDSWKPGAGKIIGLHRYRD
jgi:hypothetical protein